MRLQLSVGVLSQSFERPFNQLRAKRRSWQIEPEFRYSSSESLRKDLPYKGKPLSMGEDIVPAL